MKIGVVGTGYVGLVTAAGFASRGHHVTCVDISPEKIASLESGVVPWYEPGLSELVTEAVEGGRLAFTTDISVAAESADLMFVAVGTPPNDDGSADTSAVFKAAEDIGKAITRQMPVVVRSTVPVGTTEKVRAIVAEEAGFDCPALSNPEFLREGKAVEDFNAPSRVVIGCQHYGEAQKLVDLYSDFVAPGLILTVDTRSSEMSKYASNAFLAAKISFMNEIASLCEALGADVEDVRKVMGFDPRIGSKHLAPGIGYGGSCLPKDTLAVIDMGRRADVPMPLMENVHSVNERQPARLLQRLTGALDGSLSGKTVAVWGLAFKQDTDDVRNAPALRLIDRLASDGASIRVFDPMAMDAAKAVLGDEIEYAEDMYECVADADAVVIVTDWSDFKTVDWQRIKGLMNHPIVVDGRNMHDPIEISLHGIDYYSVGRVPAETDYGLDADDDLDAGPDMHESIRTFGAD